MNVINSNENRISNNYYSIPTQTHSALAESNVTSFELDEAYRIINDVFSKTTT